MTAPELCACGKPATKTLYIHTRYPRRRYEPDAMDPWFVHGGAGAMLTCGSPRCTTALLNWHYRPRIVDDMTRPGGLSLNPEQLAGLELTVHEPGDTSWIRTP